MRNDGTYLAQLLQEQQRPHPMHMRQQYHFMGGPGWINDPNGLCRCGEWYHVFYQYGPFDPEGGVKHWGHYRSRDLLCWEKCPVLLFPSDTWDLHGVFSGSALVEDGVMYLYYTGNVLSAGAHDYITSGRGHNTALAVCRDGLTAETNELLMENRDYPAGLSCHVRDPKVWAQDGRYYMVQGARTLDDRGEVLVFESTDKRRWTHINTIRTPAPFGYMWECPDLFELDGQWFLAVSPQGIACQNVYGCGYFALQGDWRTDCTLSEFHALDDGFDYYAPQSFAAADGRRIQFGWMGMPDADYTNPTVEYGWQHCLTLPRVLTQDGNGCLLQAPAAELNALRGEARQPADGETVETDPCFDLTASPAGDFVLTIANGLTLTYTEADRTCTLRFTDAAIAAGRTERKAVLDAPCRSLRVVGDASSLEIFLNDGAAVLSTRYYPAAGKVAVQLCGAGSTLYSLSI